MKSAPFAYRRADTLAAASRMLAESAGDAALIAGGQSLSPLLNLRMTMCDKVVDIGALAELRKTHDLGDRVFIGAGVTHAMIEDGLAPDPAHGLLRRAASHIAYRAVRCHGTMGGSVAMADPAADWPCILLALDAVAVVATETAERRVAMNDLLVGAYETSLRTGEIIRGFEIPKLPETARAASLKVNRKTGAFAMSLAVAVRNGAASRVTLGAAASRAHILPRTSLALAKGEALAGLSDPIGQDVAALLAEPDAFLQNLHATNVRRVIAEVWD